MEGYQCGFDCHTLLDKSPTEKIHIPILETVEPFILPDSLGFIGFKAHQELVTYWNLFLWFSVDMTWQNYKLKLFPKFWSKEWLWIELYI